MSDRRRRHRRDHPRIRRRSPPGAAPGTLTIDPQAPAPSVRVLVYGPEDYAERKIENPDELRGFVGKWPVTWVIVEGLGNAETIAAIGEVFGFHPLALEDVANTLQRAKLDDYGEYLFLEGRIAALKQRLESHQISIFLGSNYLVTFEERPGDCLEPVRERIRKAQGRLRQAGPDLLAYAVIDAVVDGYFPILDAYAERLEDLDEHLDNGTSRAAMARLHEMRADLLVLRRAIWPHREVINSLVRDPHPLVSDHARLFLRDCLDHVVTIVELTETYREMCSDLRDYTLSTVSYRLNEVMKVLTVIATVFMPLSFLASLYGMNFDTSSPWNMPELRWKFGYFFVLGLMGTVAGVMLLYFRWRGWMGPEWPREGGNMESSERTNGVSPYGDKG